MDIRVYTAGEEYDEHRNRKGVIVYEAKDGGTLVLTYEMPGDRPSDPGYDRKRRWFKSHDKAMAFAIAWAKDWRLKHIVLVKPKREA